jgi:hypothetical protein
MNFSSLLKLIFISAISSLLLGCYSFKGISIPPSVETFYVETFQNRASNAPADLTQRFSEELRSKINSSSRLNYSETDPHIEFSGALSSYNVRSVAPREGNELAYNRLEVRMQVEYLNNLNDDDAWTQSFSFFQDFDSSEDLTSVQDQLLEEILEQLAEDIFNKAFTNW